jgi:hypothetical protein
MYSHYGQLVFAQISSTAEASLRRAQRRTLFVAKVCRPWNPPISRPCVSPQGASCIALVRFPGWTRQSTAGLRKKWL